MNPKTKFKIKCYIIYLLTEPFLNAEFKFKLQPSTLKIVDFVGIILSVLVFKSKKLFILFIIAWVLIHFYLEWKNAKFIYFVRMRDNRLKKWREVMNRIRKEKREKMLESKLITNNSEQNKLDNQNPKPKNL